MKSNRKNFFAQKSYNCNILKGKSLYKITIAVLSVILLLTGLTACNGKNTNEQNNEYTLETKSIETKEYKEAKEKSLEIAALYKDIYANAEKVSSDYYYERMVIPQSAIDEIETLLAQKGYPVLNSDSKYPSYLENADSVYEFWETVTSNKNAKQDILSVCATGELYYTSLYLKNNQKYRTFVIVGWNENNEPYISSSDNIEIMDWELTDNDDFYYQPDYPIRGPMDEYLLVRLKPVDKELYDLAAKYIAPIGYLSNNMFITEWSSENYSNLAFNDLLDFLYKIEKKDYFYSKDLEHETEPYYHYNIPASLFEEIILPYFDISLQEFRERCLYDGEKNIYPWQEICCDNVTYYPTVEPEVIKYQENADGTLTLTVNVRCNDYKTERLFTHEVIIRVLDENHYQYLGNKITYKSDIKLPPDFPRLPPQRNTESTN